MKWQAHTGNDYTVVMRADETTDSASIRLFCADAPELAVTIAAALNDQREEPRCDYQISDDGVMSALDTWQRDNESTSMRLLSVSIEAPLEVVATWSDNKVQAADIWAWTCMLDASDNEGIQVPAKPAFLPEYTRFSSIVPA